MSALASSYSENVVETELKIEARCSEDDSKVVEPMAYADYAQALERMKESEGKFNFASRTEPGQRGNSWWNL